MLRPSLRAISLGLSPSSTNHFFASITSVVDIFVHDDISGESRNEVWVLGAHAHSQCLGSQALRKAARAPRRMREIMMDCACIMLVHNQETQRLMEKILHHLRSTPSSPEVVWRTTPHHTPPLLPHRSMLGRATTAPVKWCKIFSIRVGVQWRQTSTQY